MRINAPAILAEVTAAFERYEAALVSNDIVTLDALFLDDATTIRYGGGENLYGIEAIRAFRAARSSAGLGAPAGPNPDHHLWRRLCSGCDTVLSRDYARQGRPADADVGKNERGLAGCRGACQHYCRA